MYPEDTNYEFDISPLFWDEDELTNNVESLLQEVKYENPKNYRNTSEVIDSLSKGEMTKSEVYNAIVGNQEVVEEIMDLLTKEGIIYERPKLRNGGNLYGLNHVQFIEEEAEIPFRGLD